MDYDLVAVIGSYIPLTKVGRKYRAICPFHSDKAPSFIIENGVATCAGCGWSGGAVEFVGAIEDLDQKRAQKKLESVDWGSLSGGQ